METNDSTGHVTGRGGGRRARVVWVVVVAAVTTVAGAAAWAWGRQADEGAAPTVTLAAVPVPPGAEPVRQELSKPCSTAVAPLRELMADVPDGRLLDAAGAERLNAGLAAGAAACDTAEWARFHELELRGWLSPAAPLTVPATGAPAAPERTPEAGPEQG